MFVASVIVMLVGVVLLAMGRRGWLEGHHPRCRSCEYDLSGLPGETRRCPECGADILAEGAIQIGGHRPMRGAMVAGGVMMAVGALGAAFAFGAWWVRFDGSPYKPLSVLRANLNAPDESLRARSCAEMLRRIRGGRVSAEEAGVMADVILRYQANPAARWAPQWGDLMQAGRDAGAGHRIADDRWRRYLDQAMVVTVAARPRVGAHDPVPIAVDCRWRAGSDLRLFGTVQPEVVGAMGDVHAMVALGKQGVDSVPMPLKWAGLWNVPAAGSGSAVLPVGMQALRMQLKMTLEDRAGSEGVVVQEVELPVEVLPKGQSSVRLGAAPSAEVVKEMEQAIQVRVGRSGSGRLAPGQLGSVFVSGVPMAVAFRVMLRQGDREWLVGRVLLRPDDAMTVPLGLGLRQADNGPAAGHAELLFIPDTGLATGTVDVLEIWPTTIRREIEVGAR